jgi:hypothetical protein
VRADQRGQTAAEYLGLLVVVALVLAGIGGLGIGHGSAADTARGVLCRLGGGCEDEADAGSAGEASAPERVLEHIAALEAERAGLLGREPWLAGNLPGPADDVRRVVDRLAAHFDVEPPVTGPFVVVDQLIGWPEVRLSRRGEVAELAERIVRFRRWAAEDRQLLTFDPSGDGRVVEVIGDVPLSEADHVVVLVPGVFHELEKYDWLLRARAREVHDVAVSLAGDETVATVAWLGYDPPDAVLTWASATGGSAAAGGAELARFVAALDAVAGPGQHQTVIGHSYGSLVAADALAAGADVDEAVLIGSPGVRRDTVADLGTDAVVWVGKTARDEIDLVPNVRLGPLGHGRDPTDPRFGARRFDTGGAVGHGGYFSDLRALSRIVQIALDHEEAP